MAADRLSSTTPAALAQPRLSARERIIVALDVPDLRAQEAYLDRLAGGPAFYKVGLELFVAAGASAIDAVKRRGGRVFLDLKLHDIPETVARAVASCVGLGVDLLTVHACGGHEMLARAVAAASSSGTGTRVIGVTVLTSLGESDLGADGIAGNVADAVVRRAEVGARAGLAGFVCSPLEAAALRARHPHATLVVPGVRPAGAALGDQKRVATPADTVRAGADYLVVGRPLRDAANPAQAFAALVRELEEAGA